MAQKFPNFVCLILTLYIDARYREYVQERRRRREEDRRRGRAVDDFSSDDEEDDDDSPLAIEDKPVESKPLSKVVEPAKSAA
jgi:hypothetical protein